MKELLILRKNINLKNLKTFKFCLNECKLMSINKYEVVKFIDNDFELDITISPEEDNIWLSKNQIAELFDMDRSVISKHIKKIFEDYECDEKSNVQKMHIPNSDKLVEFYSLDIIISVGFKTNSKRAIIFRRWANKVLKENYNTKKATYIN